MSNVTLVPPIALATSNISASMGGGASYLGTPDPKEAWVSPIVAGNVAALIDIDLGASRRLDTLFLGYTNLPATGSVQLLYGDAAPGSQLAGQVGIVPARSLASQLGLVPPDVPQQHVLLKLAQIITARFLRVVISHGASVGRSMTVGVLAVGASFTPALNYDYGSGRTIGDTGSATRMLSGSFVFDEGVSFGGWSCTLSELTDDERDQLYDILRVQKTTRSLLVAEDPDQTSGLSERLHWSILGKLDAYERRDANLNRYALTVLDWA